MLPNVRRGEGRRGNSMRVARKGGGGGWCGSFGGIKSPSKSKPGAFLRGLNREGRGFYKKFLR